jgi:hypothetical protein
MLFVLACFYEESNIYNNLLHVFMVTETEDKNNKEYATNYARGRSGDIVRDAFNSWEDHDSIEYQAYKAGERDRSKFGFKSQDDCGSGESSEPVVSDPSDSCCFITSACLDDLHLPRTDLGMVAMKTLVRNHILKTHQGKRDYVTYGKIAPGIVRRIRARKDSLAVWNNVYSVLQGIVPSVQRGDYQEGYEKYKSLVLGLEAELAR